MKTRLLQSGDNGEFHLPEEELKLVPPPAPDIFQDVEVRMTVEGATEYASASSERVIDLEQRLLRKTDGLSLLHNRRDGF